MRTCNVRLAGHDENINNLNRLTEENIRANFKQNETLEKIRNTNELLLEKVDKQDKNILKINNELLRFIEVEKNIRENSSKIEETSKSINDFQYYSNVKFSDLDMNILNILNSISEINQNLEKRGTSMNVNMASLANAAHNSHEQSNAQMISEISKSNKEIESLKKLFREFNERVDKISKLNSSLEEQIKDVKTEINNIPKEKKSSNNNNNPSVINGILKAKEDIDRQLNEGGNNINVEANGLQEHDILVEPENNNQALELLFDRMKKFQESIKSMTNTIGQKTEKTEFEKLTRTYNQDLEKINKRINEINTTTEIKIKNLLQNPSSLNLSRKESNIDDDSEGGPGTLEGSKNNLGKSKKNSQVKKGKNSQTAGLKANLTNGDGFEFDEGIVNMTREIIERELAAKDEIIKMQEFMEEYKAKAETSKVDIDKLFESIVEIRSSLSTSTSPDDKIASLKDKLHEVELTIKKQRILFEERFKNLEGESTPEEENPNSDNNTIVTGGSIKDNIKNLNSTAKIISEKIEKVTLRLDNMNNEILAKVKKDLSTESGKILIEFKGDLKNSITKIEEQLREKVDKFSLDEFGKYVNEKLSQEMNKKLDRNDLKKNNNLINKKIDTLENKISRTLVDTLIDLQMEEAPLIVKKTLGSTGNEKCASCNQFVMNTTLINEDNLNETKYHNTNTTQKFKFKNVQESCYKFGAGSYSRYLSSIENVNEEIRNNRSVQLPEINNNNKTAKKFNYIPTGISEAKLKNKILEEYSDKNYLNTMINEELEKKIVNPENLIKTANKLFETVEKEKRNMIHTTNYINK